MASRYKAAAVAACLTLVVPTLLASPASAATKVATIDPALTPVNLLNINDFHGRIDGGSLDGKLGKQVACTIQQARTTLGADKTAFLSAGDSVGASTFASFIANDQPTIDFLNALGLAASSVGNHEYDQGSGDLTGRIMPAAHWTYLGANVYQRGTTTPALPEYKVVTVNGVRVGVIGAVTQQTPNMVSPSGVSGLDFGDPVTAVNRVADKLKASDLADIIVAEYHEGAPLGTSLADQTANSAVFAHIVNDTSAKVDVIFNGHTHAVYTWDGATASGTRSVSQSASYGAYVGQVQLGYDPATKTVKEYITKNLATSAIANPDTTCAADATYTAAATVVNNAVANAKVLGAQVIGKVSADITRAYGYGSWVGGVYTSTKPDDRQRESDLGNLEAEAWRQAMNVPGRPGADIGLQNPGGVRADLKFAQSNGEGDGNVTYAEAAAINPFANTMVVGDITGAQLKATLEQQWQPAGSSRAFLHLGLSKNVRWTFDETRPAGDKVTSIWVNDTLVTPTAVFRMATNSFLAAGGDNFTTLASAKNVTDTGVIDMDAFINFLKNAGTLKPDFAKQAVEVEGVPALVECGTTLTMKLQGWDMTSLGAPQNTSAAMTIDGQSGSYPVTITRSGTLPDIAGVPTLDGHAAVSIDLPKTCTTALATAPAVLRFTSATTGTVVTVATQLAPAPAITTTDAATTVGFALTAIQPVATGGSGTLVYSASGLPAGVTIDAATGSISGTPTAVGSFPYTVTVTDGAKLTATASGTITVNALPTITSGFDVTLQEGGTINGVQPTASGGTAPYKFTATGLPDGVTINPQNGIITGTPTVPGVYPITITLTDAAGATFTINGTITVKPNVAEITGRIFVDENRDGVYNAGEKELTGVTVQLIRSSSVIATTVTHSPYVFTKAPNGAYIVKVVKDGAVSGYKPCDGSWTANITVTNPDSVTQDFAMCGYTLPQTGSVLNVELLVASIAAGLTGAGLLLVALRRRRETA